MTKRHKHGLFWFRRDLRTRDNVGFTRAMTSCEMVTCVFIFDTEILDKLTNKEDKRVVYIHRSLQEVDHFLQRMHSKLLVRIGNPRALISEIVTELNVDAVFTNEDYEPFAKARDQLVAQKLQEKGRLFFSFKDQVIFAKDEIRNGQGKPYKVFTPYKNKWISMLTPRMIRDMTFQHYNFTPYEKIKPLIKPWRLKDIGFEDSELMVEAGQDAAEARLASFAKNLDLYQQQRDFPAIEEGTSGLSVCLRFGTVSIRDCTRLAKSSRSKGAQTWLSELIWRDFYHMILDQFPHVATHPFNEKYDGMVWPGTQAHFKRWCQGMTGVPIVDAAMRCLNQTGWMHNRLRMIVAMFLTKDLLCDYRWGEAYFAEKLLDFDLAANNGGWQWSASTGCDAQPYFRVFNPYTQSEKFDAQGDFIRRYCVELMHFPNKYIHHPAAAPLAIQKTSDCIVGKDYPAPIVDHSMQRKLAIDLFKI
ncbi:MAG: deoxyribodipyrimidine photo-lyase [Deltaproteobacteria bacterium]|nr:deoxyribodipyrimidine photo-lyase [Deltaproteobacteria bacterium]